MSKKCYLGIFLTVSFLPSANAGVLGVTLKPTLTFSQAYSDNLTLGSSSSRQNPESGFVTQLAPMLNVVRDTANSKLNLTARLQYLYYEGVDISSRLYPQLQMTSKTEVFDDSIFVDSTSTIGQGNASAIGGISSSNINQSSSINSTTYRTFRFSPYWVPHLGGYAEGEVRLAYSHFGNSTSGSAATTGNNIGNLGTNSYQESLHLKSGRKFDSSGLTWRLSLSNQDMHYVANNNSTVRFRSYNGELSHHLLSDISAFVQAGYYDNQYSSGNISAKNGLYVTPGLSWTPSSKLSLAAGYGYNAYFSNVSWHPSPRTSFQLNYRNSKVGGSSYGLGLGGGATASTSGAVAGFDYNPVGGSAGGTTGAASPTGALGASNAGSTWNGSLNYHTRTSNWIASYYTTTTTLQQLLTNSPTFATPYDANGNPIGDTTAIERAINTPNYTNGIMISKRAQMSTTWSIAKSNVSLSAYHNNITYSSSNNRPQDILGVSANWQWQFSPRLNAGVLGHWQNSSYSGNTSLASSNTKTDYFTVSLTLNRKISSDINAYLQFMHTQTNSSNINNNLNGLGMYDSNRVTASLSVTF